MAIDMPVDL